MGYTHYYTQNRDFTFEEWQEIVTLLVHMLDHLPAHTTSAGGYYADQPLEISSEYNGRFLMFNGKFSLGHEDFYLKRQGSGFQFCKTERKPYDLIVCALLLAIQEIAPNALEISSDGDMRGDDWQPAREFLANLPGVRQIEAEPTHFLEVENVS